MERQRKSIQLFRSKKIIEGKEAEKEFVQKLSALNLPNIQTLADVDKKFHLKTKEVVIFKTDGLALYNLLQSNGTNGHIL